MSFTRLDYDSCAYAKALEESKSPLDYNLYMGKYENEKQCPVGDFTNNLEFGAKTDLESELRGQTRLGSKCPSKKFNPNTKVNKPNFSPPTMCDHVHHLTRSGLKRPETDGLTEKFDFTCGSN